MKTFNFKITADTSEITKQFEEGAKAVKDLALQAEKAEDKLEVLQQTSNYIKQMDAALAKVKKKYPNLFQEIFGNVNKQINESLAPLKKMPEEMTKIFGKTKVKLDNLIANPTAATVSDIEEIGNVFKTLAKTMGNSSLDFKFLDGSSKNETKIKKLTAAMKELEQSYFNVGAAAGSEIKASKTKSPKPKKDSGADGGITPPNIPGDTIKDNKKVAMSYDELTKSIERYIEISKRNEELANKWSKNRTSAENAELDSISDELIEIESRFDKIKDGSSNILFDLTGGDIDKDSAINQLVDLLGVQLPQAAASGAKQAEDASMSYDKLIKNVERYIEISKRNNELADKGLSNWTPEESDEADQISNELEEIEGLFETIKKDSSEVLLNLSGGDIDKDSAIKQLANLLEVEIPNASISAGQSIENATNNAGQSIEDLTLKIKTLEEELKKIKDVEAGTFFDSKTGKFSSIDIGEKNSVGSKLIDYENASKDGYDTRVHTHVADIAAPSVTSDTSDFSGWIKVFDHIKKHAIKANKEILSFDFSSLTKETLQEIANKYKELATPIIEDFKNPPLSKLPELGGFDNMDNEMQRRLREALDGVMKDYPGVMTSFPIDDGAVADGQQLVTTITNVGKSAEVTSASIGDLSTKLDEAQKESKELEERILELEASQRYLTQDRWELQSTLDSSIHDRKEATIKTFDALTSEIGANWSNMTDVNIGRNTEGLEIARKELKLLAEQGAITSEEMDKFEAEYNEAMHQLDMRKSTNEFERERAQDALRDGNYSDGYSDGYHSARNDYIDALDEKQEIINKLQQELNEAQQRISGGGQIGTEFGTETDAVKSNIQAEIDQLEILEKKILEVKQAVEQKTQSFVEEGTKVDSVVISEIAALDKLITKLNEVKTAVDAKSDAFKQEGGVVDGAVKKATKKAPKKQESTDGSKEVQDAQAQADAEAKKNKELRKQAELRDNLINQKGTLNHLEKEAKKAEKVIGGTFTDVQAEQYERLIAAIGEYKKSKEILSEEELKYIRDTVSGYQQQAKAINEAKAAEEKRAAEAKAAEEKAKNAFGKKDRDTTEDRLKKAFTSTRNFKDSAVIQNQLQVLLQYYTKIDAEQKKLANSTEGVTEEQEQAFKNLVANFNQEFGKLNKIVSEAEKFTSKSRFEPVKIDPSIASDVNKLEQEMKKAIKSGENGKVRFGEFNRTLKTQAYEVKTARGEWTKFEAVLDSTESQIGATNSSLGKTNTFLRGVALGTMSKLKSAIANVTGYDIVYRVVNQVKQGITYVREIDSALVELKKVTDETEESYARFLQTASKTADRIGSTVKDVTTMTADWARLGYSMQEAASLAESTGILLNVSEFSDANQASEALISTIQAYGYAADESMSVVDVLNEVKFTCLLVW